LLKKPFFLTLKATVMPPSAQSIVLAKSKSNLSLRSLLIVPFVLQIFTAVGLTGYISLRNGQQAINDLATRLRSGILARGFTQVAQFDAERR
jgi:hypothetical protein